MQAISVSFDDFATPKNFREDLPAWFWIGFPIRYRSEELARCLKELWDVSVGPTVRAVEHVSRRVLGFDLRGRFAFSGERHHERNERFAIVNGFE